MRATATLTLGLLLGLVTAPRAGADWSQWRGPFANGSADTKGLPVHWSATENTAWITDLPGPSAATPSVIRRTRLPHGDGSVTASTLLAMCLDRQTGKVLWTHAAGAGQHGPREGFENSRRPSARPSPTARRACFMFGNGVLIAFDLRRDTELWKRNSSTEYGADREFSGATRRAPCSTTARLYVQVLRSGESFLLAVDPQDRRDALPPRRRDDPRDPSPSRRTRSPIPSTTTAATGDPRARRRLRDESRSRRRARSTGAGAASIRTTAATSA